VDYIDREKGFSHIKSENVVDNNLGIVGINSLIRFRGDTEDVFRLAKQAELAEVRCSGTSRSFCFGSEVIQENAVHALEHIVGRRVLEALNPLWFLGVTLNKKVPDKEEPESDTIEMRLRVDGSQMNISPECLRLVLNEVIDRCNAQFVGESEN